MNKGTFSSNRHILIVWIGNLAQSVKEKTKCTLDCIDAIDIRHYVPTINEGLRQDNALLSNILSLSREFRQTLEDRDCIYLVGEFSKPGICSYMIPALMIAAMQSVEIKLVYALFQSNMITSAYPYDSHPYKLSSWLLYLHRFQHIGIKAFLYPNHYGSDIEGEVANYLISSISNNEPCPIKYHTKSRPFEEITASDCEHNKIQISIGKTPIEALNYARQLDNDGGLLKGYDFLGITSSSETVPASFKVLHLYNERNGITFSCNSIVDRNNGLMNYILYENNISNFLSNYKQAEISCDLDDEDSIECLLGLVKTLNYDHIKISRILCAAAPRVIGKAYNRPSGETVISKLKEYVNSKKIKVLVDPFLRNVTNYNPAEKKKMLALAAMNIPYFGSVLPFEEIHTEYDFSFNSIRLVQFTDSKELIIRNYSFENKQLDFVCKKEESVFTMDEAPFTQSTAISQDEWRMRFGTGKVNFVENRRQGAKEEIGPQDLVDRLSLNHSGMMFAVNSDQYLMQYAFYWYLSGEDLGLYCMYVQNQKRYRVLNKSNYR